MSNGQATGGGSHSQQQQHSYPVMELLEPPISVSEIGPIPPPPMFSSPSPLPAPRSYASALPPGTTHREQMQQQREREQSLAAAIAMVVHNARNVDMYQLSHGRFKLAII